MSVTLIFGGGNSSIFLVWIMGDGANQKGCRVLHYCIFRNIYCFLCKLKVG